MTDNKPHVNITFQQVVILAYLALAVVVGALTMAWIVSIPGEQAGARLVGLSGARLLLLSSILLVTGAFAWLFVRARRDPDWFVRWSEAVNARLEVDRVRGVVLLLTILGVVNGCSFITRIPGITEPVTLAYYPRLQPLVLWVALLCGLTLLGIYLLRHGFNPRELGLKDPRLRAFGWVIGILVVLTLTVAITGFGILPIDEGIGWYPLGTPLLVTQVFLAWIITLGVTAIWVWWTNPKNTGSPPSSNHRLDGLLGFTLWLGAFILWNLQPLKPNWFASEPRPPNFAFYPNSDASVYDITAQNLALGEGFKTRGSPFTLRPAYAGFLAVAHAVGGPDYESIIWMQVAVLALIPVGFYHLTARLHNRFAGLLGALLLILRETNAIRLGDTISDAHAKLLMPFLPTTLGILLTLWLMVKWMAAPDKRSALPLVSGGLVGIFMLVRPEFGVVIPFIGLAALLQLRKQPSDWVRGMAFVLLGLGLSLAPWIWRNYQLTGTIFIDSPQYRLDLLNRRYREEPLGFVPTPIPESTATPQATAAIQPTEILTETPIFEGPAGTSETQAPLPTPESAPLPETFPDETIQEQTRRLVADVVDFIRTKPATMTDFILKHFLNSQVQTALNLPVSYPLTQSAIAALGHRSLAQFWQDCCTLAGYERDLPFWPKWDGVLPDKSLVPLGLNFVLVALGISTAWRKVRFAGLVPLFGSAGYTLINAVVRNSGGRYILPVDWVSYCYFAIGLAEVTHWGISFFSSRFDNLLGQIDPPKIRDESRLVPRWAFLGIACGFLLLGAALPIAERAIPSKLAGSGVEGRVAEILDDTVLRDDATFVDTASAQLLKTHLEHGGMALYGRALYPRFHTATQMDSVWYFYQDRPYNHIDFYLSSPHDTGVVVRSDDTPAIFPHATDVLVFACPEQLYADALAVILYNDAGDPIELIWRSPLPDPVSCPLPTP